MTGAVAEKFHQLLVTIRRSENARWDLEGGELRDNALPWCATWWQVENKDGITLTQDKIESYRQLLPPYEIGRTLGHMQMLRAHLEGAQVLVRRSTWEEVKRQY